MYRSGEYCSYLSVTCVRQAVDPHPPHPSNIIATNKKYCFLERKSKCLWLRRQPCKPCDYMSNILRYSKETTFHIFFLLFLEKLKYWKKYVEIEFWIVFIPCNVKFFTIDNISLTQEINMKYRHLTTKNCTIQKIYISFYLYRIYDQNFDHVYVI